jgi:3-isopropylmalate dehydrogenase
MKNLLILPGDGIGDEITRAAVTVLDVVNERYALDLNCRYMEIGFASLEKTGTTCPDEVLAAAKQSDGIILGPISHMDYPARDKGGVNVSAAFRVKLDLYANVRPARSRLGLSRTGKDMDLVIMRECTEGFYPDRNMWAGTGEFMPTPDIALSVRKITAWACERIARRAFELAMRRRRKITAVHKANNMILTDGLYLREIRKVAAEFPKVEYDEIIVDAMAAMLVRDPGRFDVVITSNFYGDILSDLASELAGGLGLAGSVNVGDTLCAAQAQHGSAPDIAGQDKANPTSLILSTAMLLSWIGEKYGLSAFRQAAAAVEASIDTVLEMPDKRTPDLGGPLGTKAFAKTVAEELAKKAD